MSQTRGWILGEILPRSFTQTLYRSSIHLVHQGESTLTARVRVGCKCHSLASSVLRLFMSTHLNCLSKSVKVHLEVRERSGQIKCQSRKKKKRCGSVMEFNCSKVAARVAKSTLTSTPTRSVGDVTKWWIARMTAISTFAKCACAGYLIAREQELIWKG